MLLFSHPTTAATVTTTKSLLFHRLHHSDLTPDLSHSLSFASRSALSSQSLLTPRLTTSGNPAPLYVTRAFPWSSRKNEVVEYEKRPKEKWLYYYEKLSSVPDIAVVPMLNSYESQGKRVNTIYLFRAARELGRSKLYLHALEVYKWVENKPPDTFPVTTNDRAFKLDMIFNAHGASSAEEYFLSLKESMKDRLVYGALLKVYAACEMKEKAESLYATMKEKDMVDCALFTNVMMTLYTSLEEHDKVDSIILEMRKKGFSLNSCSYNIWLTSLAARNSFEKMDEVFELMKKKPSIDIGLHTFGFMSFMYFKMGELEKAEQCLKQMESKIDGQDHTSFYHLFSHYGILGKPRDIHRLWEGFKAKFATLCVTDYREVIKSLVICDDVKGAEAIYDEWLLTNPTTYDPRVGNILLACYVTTGETEKVEPFFNQMVSMGGNQNPRTWEILAVHHIGGERVAEALSCLKEAVSVNGSKEWKPNSELISSILKRCDEEGDVSNKSMLFELLKQTGYPLDELEKKGADNEVGVDSV